MNLVSIIVPMYNEELNIESCINFLKKQKTQDFDVFFIDDGSEDRTVEKLEQILELGVQFNYKIIKQSNQGAATARKAGIDCALTEYIMIFDCDDKLSSNLVSEVYEIYNNYIDVDIILPDMYIENINKVWSEFVFYTTDINLSSVDCVKYSLNGWRVHGFMVVKKSIFSKSYSDYMQHNNYNKNYINNDEVITRLNFSNSRNIIRSEAIYYYCYNNLSTTKKVNKNKYLMIENAIIIKNYYSNNSTIRVSANEELIAVVWGVVIYMYKNKTELDNLIEWNKTINNAIKKIDYIDSLIHLGIKKKIQLTILKLLNLF